LPAAFRSLPAVASTFFDFSDFTTAFALGADKKFIEYRADIRRPPAKGRHSANELSPHTAARRWFARRTQQTHRIRGLHQATTLQLELDGA
jgi:hypothetical protein